MIPAYEIIKSLRLKNGLSQKELADRVNLSQQAVALIESGKRKVEFDLFVKMAEAMKETLIDIFLNYRMDDNDEIYGKIGDSVIHSLDSSFVNILKAHGAHILFDDDDNYAIKYNGKIVSLTDDEFFSFRDGISHFIYFSLDELFRKKGDN